MLLHSFTRNDLPRLCKEGGIGVELGVWKGSYSDVILRCSKLKLLLSIDGWQFDWSNKDCQIEAKKLLAVHRDRSVILSMTFSEAVRLIADRSLDFIYIDGCHDYNSIKRDIRDWWPKLKSGGIFSGHDYMKCGLEGQPFGVIEAVDEFAKKRKLSVRITGESFCPSWYLRK